MYTYYWRPRAARAAAPPPAPPARPPSYDVANMFITLSIILIISIIIVITIIIIMIIMITMIIIIVIMYVLAILHTKDPELENPGVKRWRQTNVHLRWLPYKTIPDSNLQSSRILVSLRIGRANP